ncbi:MAG: IclR family transcriptional regulator [Desulfovibrionaceae bacterium]
MPQADKKYYTIGAITKACTLLEKLSEKKTWELSELCKALDMPKTTVHRMLLTLEDEGFVTQAHWGGMYSLSYKLFSIGRKVVNYSNIVDVVKPFTEYLLDELDETINLCVVSGTDMIILDKKVTTQALRPDNIVGSSFPIFYSASGKAFLSFTPQEYYDATLEKIRANTTPRISDQAFTGFLQEISDARVSGLAYDNEEIFQGVRCVAAPIIDLRNNAIAALSVSAPTVRLSKKTVEKIERLLFTAAKKISLQLGTTHPLYFTE